MAYEGYLKDKIKRLEELIKKSEYELKEAQSSLDQGELVSKEIIQLNKKIINLEPLDPEGDRITDNIQRLLEEKADIYWNYLNLSERLEIRNKSLLTFKKFPKENQEKLAYEKLIIEYGIFINDILNENKRIWWNNNNVFKRKKERFLILLNKEFENILSKRKKICLLPKEKLNGLILMFEEEKIRKNYSNEEFKNLIQFKELFNQIHDNYREDVFFL